MRIFLILILFFTFIISARAQDYPDSGFTNKAEAKNLMVNGMKEGKWVEGTTITDTVEKEAWIDSVGYKLSIYKNNKPVGIVRFYDRRKNGKLSAEVPYNNGMANGIEKGYYESGKLELEVPFKDDSLNGVEKIYYENGTIEFETPYKNGKKYGIEKGFYESGELMYEYSYINDKINGIAIDYYDNGNISMVRPFREGKIIDDTVKFYYEDGKLWRECPYNNDKASGVEKEYYESGKLKSETIYVHDTIIAIKNYDENGNEIK